jgi:hypothetical protein
MRAHISSSNAAGGMLWATWSLTRHEHEGKGSLDLLARGPEQDLVHEYPLSKQKPNTLPFYRSETGHSLEMFGIPIPLYRDL